MKDAVERKMKEKDWNSPARLTSLGLARTEDDKLVDLRTGVEFNYSHVEHVFCKGYLACAAAHTSRLSEMPKQTLACTFPCAGTVEQTTFLRDEIPYFKLIGHSAEAIGEAPYAKYPICALHSSPMYLKDEMDLDEYFGDNDEDDGPENNEDQNGTQEEQRELFTTGVATGII